MSKLDAIRPSHYTRFEIEPIAVINSWNLNFNLGNVIKYVARMGKKKGHPAREDLEKAIQYLNFELERIAEHADNQHCSGTNTGALRQDGNASNASGGK